MSGRIVRALAAAVVAVIVGGPWAGAEPTTRPAGYEPGNGNPILPGYYADPSIVQHEGKAYVYATLDPWGGETLGCWESADFKNWTYRELNWPTKAACTSKASQGAKVWAPSVVRARDGKFYMAVSVGSEVWVGTADAPTGPWRNALGDRPLIPGDFRPGFHMIDAEWFIDDDGAAYLYWGSGWNWENGKCWVVRMKPDMRTFDGEVRDVTPGNYFEAPFVTKRGGRYYLSYSSGNTTKDTYQVHYAVADTPYGPFEEGATSPILVTDRAKNVVSPGHHAIFERDGRSYILYHRQNIPATAPKDVLRQVCVDVLEYGEDGEMRKVVPTHEGPPLVRGRAPAGRPNLADPAGGTVATASSRADALAAPGNVLDNNYATRWAAAGDAKGAWLQLDLGGPRPVSSQSLLFEFPWKPVRFSLESSLDGATWTVVADHTNTPASGCPVTIDRAVEARFLRLVFPQSVKGRECALFEWLVQ